MDLSEFLATIRSKLPVIVAVALVGVLAATAYSLVVPKTYSATSKILLSTPPATNASDLQQGAIFAQQAAVTYAEVATTSYVLGPVVQQLKLSESADDLADDVTAVAAANTSVVDITVTSGSAADAAGIANGVARQLALRVPDITPSGTRGRAALAVRTVQTAAVPSAPSSPNLPLDVALGLLVGLALGLGFVLLRRSADTRVRTADDVRRALDKPVLGAIAYDASFRRRPLVVSSENRSPRAEAYRALRTNLQFLLVGSGSHSVVITSAAAGEGKSSSTANLAVALGGVGKRVAVVDADLRDPRLSGYFGLDGSVGLSEVLIGQVGLWDVLQRWGDGSVRVLPAGALPPNPSELLQSDAMVGLLESLKEDFDVILFDTPPALPFTDAAALGRLADGVVIAVASGRTGTQTVRRTAEAIEQAGAAVLGTVLTMTPTSRSEATVFDQYDARRRVQWRRNEKKRTAVRKEIRALGRG